MDFLIQYGLYLAKLTTLVIAILVVIAAIAAISAKSKAKAKGKLVVKKINDHFEELSDTISNATHTKHELKVLKKAFKKTKKHKKTKQKSKSRLFVIDFIGDIKASAVAALREEITAILLSAKSHDAVLVRLESPGGMVHSYGLASAELNRLKEAKIPFTIAVDKIAASGGYMMACVADRIIAAPFAVIGSIGVVAQLPNFHRFLEKRHIDFEQITAGEYKRTLTVFGENTRKGREKMQEEINDVHTLFKMHIQKHREQADIQQVATGEHWYASRALELQLVDELKTSDDFLLSAKDHFDIYEIKYKIKLSLAKKLAIGASNSFATLFNSNASAGGQDYLP